MKNPRRHPPLVRQWSAFAKAAWLVALAAGMVAYLYWFTGQERPSPETSERFFQEAVAPHIARNRAANAEAIARFERAVHAQFEQYRQRVPGFVGDITGWGNRFKIVFEGTKELASRDKEKVERHVASKFAMHIVSAEALQRDVQRLLVEFRQGIEANRNEMLAGIEAAVSSAPAMELEKVQVSERFLRQMDAHVQSVAMTAGKDSVKIGGLALLTSVLTEEATRITTTAVFTRIASGFATSMAASAATAGGAAAATSGAGAAGGSAAGPIGTAAGLVVGIGVGFLVDAVMSGRLEKQLERQCADFLTRTERAIASDADSVATQLLWAVREIERVTEPVLREQLGILP